MNTIIAEVEFLGGIMRPVFEQPDGRQYVLDDEGERAFGVWIVPKDDNGIDLPLIVEG